MKNQNYILKVTDAKKADIRKALKDAGINVRSITEVHSEDVTDQGEKGKDAKEEDDGKS